MAAGSDYDSLPARLAGEGVRRRPPALGEVAATGGGVTGAQDLVYALALEDLAETAALFRRRGSAPRA